jgi:hypothetical protein
MRAWFLPLLLLPVTVGAAEQGTPLAKQWDQFLRGKRLTQMSSYNSGGGGGGFVDRKDLFLCRTGRFLHRYEHSTSVYVPGATGSSAKQGEDKGVWHIETEGDQAAIFIRTDDGQTEGYLMLGRNERGQTLVNNTRTFVTDENDACP